MGNSTSQVEMRRSRAGLETENAVLRALLKRRPVIVIKNPLPLQKHEKELIVQVTFQNLTPTTHQLECTYFDDANEVLFEDTNSYTSEGASDELISRPASSSATDYSDDGSSIDYGHSDVDEDQLSDATSVCASETTFHVSSNGWTTEEESVVSTSGDWMHGFTPQDPMIRKQRVVNPLETFLDGNEVAQRTRLVDNFDKEDANFVRIEGTTLHRLLSEAVDTAREVIFNSYKRFAPSEEPWDAPCFVSFARDDLRALPEADRSGAGTSFGESFRAPAEVVKSVIDNTYDVRNAHAHPGCLKSRTLDGLLTHVHRLAVVMEDEAAALKARSLRDQLRTEAQKGLASIEAGFQDGRRPPRHIERTFADHLKARASDDEQLDTPPAIKEAAELWEQVYGDPSFRGTSSFSSQDGAERDSAWQFTEEVDDKYCRPSFGNEPKPIKW